MIFKRNNNKVRTTISFLCLTLGYFAQISEANEIQSEQDNDAKQSQLYLRSSVQRQTSFLTKDIEHIEPLLSSPGVHEKQGHEPLIMHTFFHRIDPTEYHKYGGMTDESDTNLLLTWEAAWKASGFQTKIVTLEDAKHHPAYEKFDRLLNLEKMPFGYYDKLCFLRWLAMAAVGGGFMSDYDTFPVRSFSKEHMTMKDLPNDGKLTVFDTVRLGGVPSVVSGSAAEFDRIAHSLLYNNLQVGVREKFWSDMLALMDVYQKNSDEYILTDAVLKGNNALSGMDKHIVRGTESTLRSCRTVVGGNIAVHFSHFSITDSVEKGYLPAGTSPSDRPKVADEFLRDWATACPDLLNEQYIIQ